MCLWYNVLHTINHNTTLLAQNRAKLINSSQTDILTRRMFYSGVRLILPATDFENTIIPWKQHKFFLLVATPETISKCFRRAKHNVKRLIHAHPCGSSEQPSIVGITLFLQIIVIANIYSHWVCARHCAK